MIVDGFTVIHLQSCVDLISTSAQNIFHAIGLARSIKRQDILEEHVDIIRDKHQPSEQIQPVFNETDGIDYTHGAVACSKIE